jgi:N-acyl-D-amino-acid deacylase
VVVKPETVADVATYDAPRRLAAGTRHVLVNGVPAIEDGELTAATPGTVLRRS